MGESTGPSGLGLGDADNHMPKTTSAVQDLSCLLRDDRVGGLDRLMMIPTSEIRVESAIQVYPLTDDSSPVSQVGKPARRPTRAHSSPFRVPLLAGPPIAAVGAID
jgi:hypothetical protein